MNPAFSPILTVVDNIEKLKEFVSAIGPMTVYPKLARQR